MAPGFRVVAARIALLNFVFAVIAANACGETIEFTWTSEGPFERAPGTDGGGPGTADHIFSSSLPFNLTRAHQDYIFTPMGCCTGIFVGQIEIISAEGERLFANFDLISTVVSSTMGTGTGQFIFTGGTGRFANATGQGTADVVAMWQPNLVTHGTVNTEWRGSITLPNTPLPGDYNHNGTVDAADYVLWRKNDGTPAGYDAWRASCGTTAATDAYVAESLRGSDSTAVAPANPRWERRPDVSAIPEPSSAFLIVPAILPVVTFLSRRACRRREPRSDCLPSNSYELPHAGCSSAFRSAITSA